MTPSYQDLYKALKVAEEALNSCRCWLDAAIEICRLHGYPTTSNYATEAASKAQVALSHIKPLLLKEE